MEDHNKESMTDNTILFKTTHATEAEQDFKYETDETLIDQEPKEELELSSSEGESMSQFELEESTPQTSSQPKSNFSSEMEVPVLRPDHHLIQDLCDQYNPDSSISEQHNDWLNARHPTFSSANVTHHFAKATEVFPEADIQSDSLYGTPTHVTDHGSIFVQITGNFFDIDRRP